MNLLHSCLRLAAAGFVSTALLACSNDFEPGSRVTKLRLLAVQAEPAFAQPGEHVQLRMLVADPEVRPLSWAFGTCTNPQASTVNGCLDALDAPLVGRAPEGDGFGLDVPLDVLANVPEAARNGAAIGALLVACPGMLAEGETQGVPVRCERDAAALGLSEFELGMKRIFIRERDRNLNPEITGVRWDGEDWPEDRIPEVAACDASKREFDDCPAELSHRIELSTSEPEHGRDERDDAFSEQTIVQYYSSEGLFEHEVQVAAKASNRWVAQGGGERVARLWLVARDDRGGVGWVTRQVQVR